MKQPELYIISDLHLCDGGPCEDFRSDDERALVSFLFHVSRRPAASLIINGDFIDFVQIQPRPRMWYDARLGPSEAESLEKLELALEAHAPVFDALRRVVASGHALRFHIGNHDLDLVWPRVQARLRARLGGREPAAISFGTEYRQAGLYVEHGHQADPANCFPDQPRVIHLDPQGVPRLERCWGTRLVEEFFNKLEALDGCEMLDNVRPRMQAALLIIRHALRHRELHATLYAGAQLVFEVLRSLEHEEDVTRAAEELGVNRRILGWLASIAGWLGLGRTQLTAKRATPELQVPSLQQAYAYGARLRDGEQLAHLAPFDGDEARAHQAARTPKQATTAQAAYQAPLAQRTLARARQIVAQHPQLQAVCFGHTHQAIDEKLRIDDAPGWPLAPSAARYFNSGSWTRTLDLHDLPPHQATFEVLRNPQHYRAGRDFLRVTWPDDAACPRVETLRWE